MTAIIDLPATEALNALNRAQSYYAHLRSLLDLEDRHHIDLCDLMEDYGGEYGDAGYEDLRQQVADQAIICEGIEERKAEAYEAMSEAYRDYYVAMGWKTVDGIMVAPR